MSQQQIYQSLCLQHSLTFQTLLLRAFPNMCTQLNTTGVTSLPVHFELLVSHTFQSKFSNFSPFSKLICSSFCQYSHFSASTSFLSVLQLQLSTYIFPVFLPWIPSLCFLELLTLSSLS